MLYFASARTALDVQSEKITLSRPHDGTPITLAVLIKYLLASHKDRASELQAVIDKSAWSVNEEIVLDEQTACVLQSGDVVAIIPPVSGG